MVTVTAFDNTNAMNSLFARAEALGHPKAHKKSPKITSKSSQDPKSTETSDPTLLSISKHTALPKSLGDASPPPATAQKYKHIANKRLRTQLTRQATHAARSKALLQDAELLLTNEGGGMEVEGEMERTWRVTQDEIAQSAGLEAARGRKELKLDGGPYRSRYTKNGRSVSFLRLYLF